MSNTFSSALFVVRGQDQGRRFNLESSKITIGRHGSNDIQLFDGKASRKHAELLFEGSRHKLVDLQSSNGTYVNDQRVEQCLLVNGDKITIGGTMLLFSQGMQEHSDASTANTGLGQLTADHPSQISKIIRAADTSSPEDLSRIFSSDSEIGVAKTQEKLRILYSESLEQSTSFDLDELLERMLELVFKMLKIDFGCILVFGEGDAPQVKARACKSRFGSALSADAPGSIPNQLPRQILQRVLETNEGVLGLRDQAESAAGQKIQLICVPMLGRYGRVGTMYVESKMPANLNADDSLTDIPTDDSSLVLDESHVEILLAIARQAARAIEEKIFSSAMLHSERMAAIGETVAMISHQIKNIMQGMGGAGFMIKEGLAQDDKQAIRRGWEILDKNQQRISDLILNMLSFSKDRKPSFHRGDVVVTVGDVVDLAADYAQEHDVQITRNLPESLELYYDEDMVSRAVHNVLLNAIDACAEFEGERQRQVIISAEQVGTECLITISDNGIGIPPGELEKIFSPFRSSKGGRGTGLGLSIARKNYQEHGGRLQVESSVGEGSTFSLFLPIWSDPPAKSSSAPRDGDATITRIQKRQ